MENTKENIEKLKQIGFKQIKPDKLVYQDISANINDLFIYFKYMNKTFPLIEKIESIDMVVKGIYEYRFN